MLEIIEMLEIEGVQVSAKLQGRLSAGYSHTVCLKADGTVVAVGDIKENGGLCNTSDWRDIVAVSIGYGHIVGLKADGMFVAVGRNDFGQCNVSTEQLQKPEAEQLEQQTTDINITVREKK